MTITIRKGKVGVQDVQFYSSASPTFSRYSSSGGVTTATAVGATHIPILNATGYFQVSNVERGLQDIMTRYIKKDHSIATYTQGAVVGDHVESMGFRNGFAATSIQTAAQNMYLREGVARIILPEGTVTAATPIQLPRKCFIFGNGRGTVVRASSTIQTSRVFSISGTVAATNSDLTANATLDTSTVFVADGTKFSRDDWILLRSGAEAAAATMELQQVKSISGNTLTVYGKLIHTFRSIATLSHASKVYPAELVMDNLTIQSTSATQGIGVAGTYLVNSKIGDQTFIFGSADEMVLARRSSYNDFNFSAENQKPTAATHTYSLYLTDNSHVNKVTGRRLGQLKDVAYTNSKRNFIFGTSWNGTYSASNIDGIVQATGSMLVHGKVSFRNNVEIGSSGTLLFSHIAASSSNVARAAATRSVAATVGIGGIGLSASSATCTFTGLTGANWYVTALQTTITTSGRPVFVFLVPEGTGYGSGIYSVDASATDTLCGDIRFYRGSTTVGQFSLRKKTTTKGDYEYHPPGGCMAIDTPVAGTYSYKVRLIISSNNAALHLDYLKLCSFEL